MKTLLNSTSSVFSHNRRDFLKTLSLSTYGILLSPAFESCSSRYSSTMYERFLEPSAEAKPFFRWWWNGNRLTKDEISRELELMHEAGIGGVEINPIQMPEQAEKLVGEECIWLSNDWIDFLQYTIEKTNSLGMITDLIVGTGWPFGGEFLEPEETIQGLKLEIIPVSGPDIKKIQVVDEEEISPSKVLSIHLFPSEIAKVEDGVSIPFEENASEIQIDVPVGSYTIFMLRLQNNFRQVMHGAPGGAGPVLDHFNKAAVEKYLNQMSDRIKERSGKGTLEGIRAMFCDSIELNGANWTTGFEKTFQEKRGYDILPYLPLLLQENSKINDEFRDELRRARFDYSLTLAELFRESFILPFHNWCRENGTQSRYQAYGHPWLYTDLIEGYLVPDIPEGDQWLFNGGWQPYADVNEIRYAIWNKYASSAGHLNERRIISSEAMTNTSGVFKASLKYIKQATDLNIATGINHLVLHGFNYSPPEAGFPGWIRYGCYYNEKNPWWQYMPEWSKYNSRLSQIFQDSSPVSQVAILGPTLDIWSEYGLDRNPFNLEPWYLHALWQALNHLGFCSDYINQGLLLNSRLEDGKILIGSMRYEVLLLCEVETMGSDIARKLEDLSNQGARIIMIGKNPSRATNMLSAPKNDGIVKKSIENTINAGIQYAASPENKLQSSPGLLMNWADQLMKNAEVYPLVEFSTPSPNLFQIQHKSGDVDILFLCNIDRNESFESEFSTGKYMRFATVWDPDSGKKERLSLNDNNRINISLQPLESILIVTDPKENLKYDREKMPSENQQGYLIDESWKITLQSVEGYEESHELESLKPINEIDGYYNFAGEIYYYTEFNLEDNNYKFLNIEEVHETAEVKLNGDKVGLSWWGNNSFNVTGKLRKGENTIEIKVTTLLANYATSLKESKTAQFWTSRYKDKRPVTCGLVGKVLLS